MPCVSKPSRNCPSKEIDGRIIRRLFTTRQRQIVQILKINRQVTASDCQRSMAIGFQGSAISGANHPHPTDRASLFKGKGQFLRAAWATSLSPWFKQERVGIRPEPPSGCWQFPRIIDCKQIKKAVSNRLLTTLVCQIARTQSAATSAAPASTATAHVIIIIIIVVIAPVTRRFFPDQGVG